jgi:hypothetical protein
MEALSRQMFAMEKHVCVCVCARVCVYVCTCVRMCVCVCVALVTQRAKRMGSYIVVYALFGLHFIYISS